MLHFLHKKECYIFFIKEKGLKKNSSFKYFKLHFWHFHSIIFSPLSVCYFSFSFKQNKYAIYAYTHGPVTGSGPSVVTPLLPCHHYALTHNWLS